MRSGVELGDMMDQQGLHRKETDCAISYHEVIELDRINPQKNSPIDLSEVTVESGVHGERVGRRMIFR